jgi:hypothetical protein
MPADTIAPKSQDRKTWAVAAFVCDCGRIDPPGPCFRTDGEGRSKGRWSGLAGPPVKRRGNRRRSGSQSLKLNPLDSLILKNHRKMRADAHQKRECL